MRLDDRNLQRKQEFELHSTTTLPDLLCGGENWTIKTSDARTAAEML